VIGGRRPLQGRKIGDRRVRVDRPHSPYFRYTDSGMLTAKEAATAPRTGFRAGLVERPRALFGRPLANEEEAEERLAKKLALPIFSSDAISSSAYATRGDPALLVVAGAPRLALSIEVAMAISLLLAVVSISYRQVCRAYPSGGGAYVVAGRTSRRRRAGGGGSVAHRLCHDRRGLHGVGGPADPVDHPAGV